MRASSRRLRVESLESRALLAAGALELSLDVPISQTGDLDVEGMASLTADILVLDPSDLTDLSVTNLSTDGSGTVSGRINLISVEGTFDVDDGPPEAEFYLQSPNLLAFELTTTGTMDLLVARFSRVAGTFTATFTGTINLETEEGSGTVHFVAVAGPQREEIERPFTVTPEIGGEDRKSVV